MMSYHIIISFSHARESLFPAGRAMISRFFSSCPLSPDLFIPKGGGIRMKQPSEAAKVAVLRTTRLGGTWWNCDGEAKRAVKSWRASEMPLLGVRLLIFGQWNWSVKWCQMCLELAWRILCTQTCEGWDGLSINGSEAPSRFQLTFLC